MQCSTRQFTSVEVERNRNANLLHGSGYTGGEKKIRTCPDIKPKKTTENKQHTIGVSMNMNETDKKYTCSYSVSKNSLPICWFDLIKRSTTMFIGKETQFKNIFGFKSRLFDN